MKWLVRFAAGCAIGVLLAVVVLEHQYVPRLAPLILVILVAVAWYEGIHTPFDDDDDNSGGPMRPA